MKSLVAGSHKLWHNSSRTGHLT